MIKVENVSKSYKLEDGNSVVGLKNVSFEVKEGEIHNDGYKIDNDDYLFSVPLISFSSPLTPSLKFLTPFPIPFISSGIFLPPNSNNTTMAIMIISPVPRFPKNNSVFIWF